MDFVQLLVRNRQPKREGGRFMAKRPGRMQGLHCAQDPECLLGLRERTPVGGACVHASRGMHGLPLFNVASQGFAHAWAWGNEAGFPLLGFGEEAHHFGVVSLPHTRLPSA